MQYFRIKPSVDGGIGDDTIMDTRVHPPLVSELNYDMDDWSGDAIVTSFPVYVVTEEAKDALLRSGATGASFAQVKITTSDLLKELWPDQKLPQFAWLQPVGKAGQDDFGTVPLARLIVSERALDVLRKLGIANAVIEPFDE